MSISIFTPLENELFELASKSDVIQDYDENYLAPLKTVIIIDICKIIASDNTDKWGMIDYGDIERISNEVTMNVIHS